MSSADPPRNPVADLCFGAFELSSTERVLRSQGQAVPLGSRALEVLIALVVRRGELVSKDELLQAVWPGLVVEEANVHVAVSQLRKVLGKSAIQTVAGLGYRFAMPLQPQPAPAPPALSANPDVRLPPQRTAFVGRQRDLQQAAAQLQQTRLLTLVGMGGMGKTRMAVQLAQVLQAQYAGGVAFVDLAIVPDLQAVPAALARALGLPAAAAGTAAEAQAAALLRLHQNAAFGAPSMLLLDNCEHLLPALASWVAGLLLQAPLVTVLATSRQALQLDSERLYPLMPLQLGADSTRPSDAEQLFVQRAQADNPDFMLDATGARLVADVCRRLDGIPLALELAAARLKMLSVQQLHGLLTPRFELLQQPASPGTQRHRTLQEVLQWSLDHLPAREQALACAVAVCSGGFDLDAAVALMGGGTATAADTGVGHVVSVLDGLAILADRALIHVRQGAGPARYDMLDTVREHLLVHLDQQGHLAAVRQRHLQYFHSLAMRAEQSAGSADAGRWQALLEADSNNLLAALAWCQQQGPLQTRLEMVTALRPFWLASCQLEQGLQFAESALAAAAGQPPSLLTARALRLAAQLCLFMSMLDRGAAHAQQALAQSEAVGDPTGAAMALCFAGRIAAKSDNTAPGEALLHQGLARAREAKALTVVGEALNALAFAAIERDDLTAAEAFFTEALQVSEQRGSVLGSMIETLNLAWVTVMNTDCTTAPPRGNPQRARELLLSVWQSLKTTPHRILVQELIDVCASFALRLGHPAEAVRLHAASAAQRQAIHLPLTPKQDERRQRELAQARGSLGAERFDGALQQGSKLTYEEAVAWAGRWLQETSALGP